MYNTVLFDLDGTIIDSGSGIKNSVLYALKKYGIDVGDNTSLNDFIGPPLTESFKKHYGFSEEKANSAVEYYREYYKEKGIFEIVVYDGIKELLEKLKMNNIKIILATSKPEVFAIRILQHCKVEMYFDFIAGATFDDTRVEKYDVIQYAIKEANVTDISSAIMIGDRKHDIIGAKKAGMDSIGVLFGYGSHEELNNAGALYRAENTKDIFDIILK